MFCDLSDGYILESIVVCTRLAGKEGRSLIQTVDLRGPITDLAESAFNLVSAWLDREYTLKRCSAERLEAYSA